MCNNVPKKMSIQLGGYCSCSSNKKYFVQSFFLFSAQASSEPKVTVSGAVYLQSLIFIMPHASSAPRAPALCGFHGPAELL